MWCLLKTTKTQQQILTASAAPWCLSSMCFRISSAWATSMFVSIDASLSNSRARRTNAMKPKTPSYRHSATHRGARHARCTPARGPRLRSLPDPLNEWFGVMPNLI